MRRSPSVLRGMRFIAAGLLAALSLSFAAAGVFSAPPTLSHLFPAGGQRGTKVVTTCTGKFSWPVMVWAPGVEVAAGKESGKLEITIPKNLAADRVWIRLYNAEGISTAFPFLIGNLREVDEQEPNNSPRDAQALEEPSATLNGVLQDGGDVDGYAVSLAAGQTLVAALDANSRLGSPMDAILQVVASNGVVVAENHDNVGLDPRLAFTATKSGTYVVRLFAFPAAPGTKIEFAGAANYIYRLTLTTGPFITHAIPLSVSQNDPGAVEVMGWNIPPHTKLPVVPFGGTALGNHQEFEVLGALRVSPDARLGFAFAPQLTGAARVRLAPHAVVPGIAQTDSKNPMTLTAPIAVTGWLRSPGQVDRFRVPLNKGQQAVISVEANSLDLPLVPVVQLTDPAGATAAEVLNPGAAREAVITHVATQDGDYHLTVGDRYRHGGDRFFYRLTVRLEEPDFELSASADALVVTADKPVEFPITVQRRAAPDGSIGPITIAVVGLPPGVAAPAVVSEPKGPTAAKVSLIFSTTGSAFSGPIRIVGTAREPRQIQRTARTPPRLAASLETIWLTAAAAKK